ncbi:MAG: response regulator [Rhodobacteraceae bacterium]|nr:response regulator [Paracoccaceae bacterium]
MDSENDYAPNFPAPTRNRPLLGLTVLAIEDSRYASEAIRLMCLRSGARIRRADSLRAAGKHLKMYQPSVVIVDLGLPDGFGADLIQDMAHSAARPDVILGTSGDVDGAQSALNAGANGFLAKPIETLGVFQEAILSHLPEDRRPMGARVLPDEKPKLDPIAYRDDMVHISEVLKELTNPSDLDYVAQFLSGVATLAEDHVLADAAHSLALQRKSGAAALSESAIVADLLRERLTNRIAI